MPEPMTNDQQQMQEPPGPQVSQDVFRKERWRMHTTKGGRVTTEVVLPACEPQRNMWSALTSNGWWRG